MEKESYQDLIYLFRKYSGIDFEEDEAIEERIEEKMKTQEVSTENGVFNMFSSFSIAFYKLVLSIANEASTNIHYLEELKNYPELVTKKINELELKVKESGITK